MNKSIMVFGAGLNQISLIKSVNKLGLISVVIDPALDPPGKKIAKYFYQVSGDDFEKTKEIAVSHKISGIVTGQMEKPLLLMARLAEEMGYIFNSTEVVLNSTNKYRMKQKFIEHDVPCAPGILIKDYKILTESEITQIHFPFIIKPLSSFSSQGVYRIRNYEDYLSFVNKTLNYSSDGSYLVEEYIDGKEYSVECITYNGSTKVVQFTEKVTSEFPYTVELGHLQPAELTVNQKDNIASIVKRGIKALGIDNSPSHCEIKWTPKGAVIIEIGARLGGDFISSTLTQESTGVNMDEATILLSIGKKPQTDNTGRSGSAILYLSLPPELRIKKIKKPEFSNKESIIGYQVSMKEEEITPYVSDSSKRAGWVIVRGATTVEAKINAITALKELKDAIIFDD